MNTTLVAMGAVFVAAALVGTGLEGAGIKIPALNKRRQYIGLTALGFLVIAIGTVPQLLANDAPGSHPATSQLQPTVTPVSAEPSSTPSASPAQKIPSPSQASPKLQAAKPNGAVLGSYTVELPSGYSIPLGTSKPMQSQFDSSEQGGDLDDKADYGTGNCLFAPDCYIPLGTDKMIYLPEGASPTYAACTGNTGFETTIPGADGLAFCVLENGKVAGIKVVSESSAPYYILKVTVWRNAS